MISIEPGDLLARHQRRLDQARIDRRQRQRLERIQRLLGAGNRLGLGDENEIFDADPISIRALIAGLFGQDNAAL